MKKLLLLISLSFSSYYSFAQAQQAESVKKQLATTNKDTVAWIHNGLFTVGANEGFLHNWAAGGELLSVVANSVFQGNLTHYNHGEVWANSLVLAYGITYNWSNNFVPRKTDDRINFTSNYGSQLSHSKDFYFSGLFDFKSQFTHGYDYTVTDWQHHPTSDFLSPAYFTLAAGMEYKKGEDLSLFLSPIAAREVLASRYYTSQSPQGAFGIDSGKTSVFQLGAYFSGKYSKAIKKSTTFTTRLDLFSNYLAKNTTNAEGELVKKDNPGNIQVYWDNLLTFKTFKSVTITLGLTVFYDNNYPYIPTTPNPVPGGQPVNKNVPDQNLGLGWTQINQVFTVGIAYKF